MGSARPVAWVDGARFKIHDHGSGSRFVVGAVLQLDRYPVFGVHREPGNGWEWIGGPWVVSHLRSGNRIPHGFADENAARAYVDAAMPRRKTWWVGRFGSRPDENAAYIRELSKLSIQLGYWPLSPQAKNLYRYYGLCSLTAEQIAFVIRAAPREAEEPRA